MAWSPCYGRDLLVGGKGHSCNCLALRAVIGEERWGHERPQTMENCHSHPLTCTSQPRQATRHRCFQLPADCHTKVASAAGSQGPSSCPQAAACGATEVRPHIPHVQLAPVSPEHCTRTAQAFTAADLKEQVRSWQRQGPSPPIHGNSPSSSVTLRFLRTMCPGSARCAAHGHACHPQGKTTTD